MSRTEPLVSIIIVNHNGLRFLEDCFTSIRKQTHRNIEVVMVDNLSEDGSVEYTKNNFPEVKIIQSHGNLGYAGGNNLGLKEAKGEYILISNNDVYFKNDLVEKMLKPFSRIDNLGAVQPMIRLKSDPRHLDACGSFWTSTGFNYHYGIYKSALSKKYSRPFPVYSLKGVCVMVRKKTLDKVGLFDDDFWCYFEETDFCHRLWLAGYSCWYYPNTYLFHHLGGTRLKKAEAFVQYHSFKNRLCSYLKNLEVKSLAIILPVYLLLNIAWIIVSLVKLNPGAAVSVLKALWWNLINIRKTFAKRRRIQHELRKVEDKNFLPSVTKNPKLRYYYYLNFNLKKYVD